MRRLPSLMWPRHLLLLLSSSNVVSLLTSFTSLPVVNSAPISKLAWDSDRSRYWPNLRRSYSDFSKLNCQKLLLLGAWKHITFLKLSMCCSLSEKYDLKLTSYSCAGPVISCLVFFLCFILNKSNTKIKKSQPN